MNSKSRSWFDFQGRGGMPDFNPETFTIKAERPWGPQNDMPAKESDIFLEALEDIERDIKDFNAIAVAKQMATDRRREIRIVKRKRPKTKVA